MRPWLRSARGPQRLRHGIERSEDQNSIIRARLATRALERARHRGEGACRRAQAAFGEHARDALRARRALRSGGGEPSDQYDTAVETDGSAASLSVRSRPAAATCGASTDPSLAVISSSLLMFVSPVLG